MPSTYSNLKIELIGTGEQTGTWGQTTNNNLQYALEEAITGATDISFANADVTLPFTNSNLAQQARNLKLNLVGTSSTPHNLIVPAIEKLYLINNTLSSDITIKNSTGNGVNIPAGKSVWVFNNAVDVSYAIDSLGNPLAVDSGGTGTTTSTGTGSVVLNTSPAINSPVLTTPNLGTPSAGTLTNCIGLPMTTGVTGTLPVFNGGTGVTTSTGSGSVVLSNSPALTTPNLGTPSAGNFTSGTFNWPTFNQNTTGTAAGLSATLAVTSGGTGVTTSTGSGSNVLNTSPTLITPSISSPSITTPTITTPTINSATLNPSGLQPLFVPRSWIRFNSNVRADINYTYAQSGTTVTVTTASPHNLVTGNAAYLNMNSGNAITGLYEVTVINSTTLTVQQATRTTSGIGIMQCATFVAGGNVNTNVGYISTGKLIINFIIPAPTTNYIILGTAGNNGDRTVGPDSINSVNPSDAFQLGYLLVDIRDTAGNRQNEDYNGVSILY